MLDEQQRFYLELDALLDTRLATLHRIDPQCAVKAVADRRYYDRVIDDFTAICGIDHSTFKAVYDKRDVGTLEVSMMTQVPLLLNDLVKKLEAETVETPYSKGVEVEVNCWPYQLSADEIDKLQLSIMYYSGVQTLVKLINIPKESVSLRYLKSRYTGAFIYNLSEFLESRGKELMEVVMPDFPMIAPALWKDKVPTPEEIFHEEIPRDVNPFRFIEMSLTANFQLNLVSSRYFSILDPLLLKKG